MESAHRPNDLQSLLDGLSLSEKTDPAQIERITRMMEETFVPGLAPAVYRQISEHFLKLSLEKEKGGAYTENLRSSQTNSLHRRAASQSDNSTRDRVGGGTQQFPCGTDQRSPMKSQGRPASPPPARPRSLTPNRQILHGNARVNAGNARSTTEPSSFAEPVKTFTSANSSFTGFFRSASTVEEKKDFDEQRQHSHNSTGKVTANNPYEQAFQKNKGSVSGRTSPMIDPLSGAHMYGSAAPVFDDARAESPILRRARSASPSIRPGLQEDNDDYESISRMSPARPGAGVPGHSRSRSNTPRFGPNSVDYDDESSLKPENPRAFSESPRSRMMKSQNQFENESANEPRPSTIPASMTMPDFTVPGSKKATQAPGCGLNDESVQTPPPRFASFSNSDNRNPSGVPTFKTADFKLRRKDGTPAFDQNFTQEDSANTFQFHLGTSHKNASYRNRIQRNRMARHEETSQQFGEGNPSSAFTTIDGDSMPRNSSSCFSPMEVDEFIKSPTFDDGFKIGLGGKPRRTEPSRMSSNNLRGAAGISVSASTESATDATAASTAPSESEYLGASQSDSFLDASGRSAFIASKRDEARTWYMKGDYKSSIHCYTEAIVTLTSVSTYSASDSLAVLYSNRAAALMMVGGFHAAASDCKEGIKYVSPPDRNAKFSSDAGPILKVKLLTRLGRVFLKLGDYAEAARAFDNAVSDANEALEFSRHVHSPADYNINQSNLSQMITESTLGKADAKRLEGLFEKVAKASVAAVHNVSERQAHAEALGHVNAALSIASSSVKLAESKVTLLSKMKRWREVAAFCERLAAFNVQLDDVFCGELKEKSPFLANSTALHLNADFFESDRDDGGEHSDLKLNSRAVAEAVVRIPKELIPLYVRALRLEERYPACDAALGALEELLHTERGVKRRSSFPWLTRERSKLERTRAGRERGDELFRTGDYELAAAQYGSCLTIDSEGSPEGLGHQDAGGRLHAVLHCNRAACLMAVKRFHEAIDECSAAIRIHPRYMKAMLRRSRCHARLQQFEEAIAEYKRWLELVSEARASTSAALFAGPCIFDGPQDATDSDVAQVKKELEDVYKAKRKADAAAREEADRRRERSQFQDSFFHNNSWNSTAEQRRENWYNQQSSTRRWDSFPSQGPRSRSHSRARSEPGQSDYSSQRSTKSSPGSDMTVDHYTVLKVSRNAREQEIKKAYRKLALQFHPDKNKNPGAADIFRRATLAYETLNDPTSRRNYDEELRMNMIF